MRTRDFIETKEGLIFAVVSYHHPKDMFIAFLRYYPHREGERVRGDTRYKKAGGTEESFHYLEKNHPEYIFHSDITTSRLQGVPLERIGKTYHPPEGLRKIYHDPTSPLDKKMIALSEFFDEIPMEMKGVTGSSLLDLAGDASDIDFVIYGLENHGRALDKLRDAFKTGGPIQPMSQGQWEAAFDKRYPQGAPLAFEEFLWHEKRKCHKAMIEGTVFDILLVRDRDEIMGSFGDSTFKRLELTTIQCIVRDDTLAFDSPSVYGVKCPEDDDVLEVVSYTHTYAGQAREGEEIEVAGYLEEVRGAKDYRRVVVGTTREAPGEYIKVVKT